MARIALVAGNKEQINSLTVFGRFSDRHEIRLHSFDDGVSDELRRCGFAFTVYESDSDRPGYMAGLEEQIASVDLIIAAGPENLASFQALRTALRSQIKFHCLAFDSVPALYDEYLNIRAIRHDILTRSDIIWAAGNSAVETLIFDGTDPARIRNLPFIPEPDCFPIDDDRRARFLEHVGIKSDCKVVLFKGPLDKKGPAGEVIKSLHALRLKNAPDFERVIVVFAGPREASDALKYMVADWKLSAHVRFLHQDTLQFMSDLMNSIDLMIDGTDASSSTPEMFAAIGALSGVRPVLTAPQRTAGWIATPCYEIAEITSLAVAKILGQFLVESSSGSYSRINIRNSMIQLMARESKAKDGSDLESGVDPDSFVGVIESVLSDSGVHDDADGGQCDRLTRRMIEIEESTGVVSFQDSIFAIEDFLLHRPDPQLFARAMFCKGNVFFTAGNFESATDAYREALIQLSQSFNVETSPEIRGVVASCYRGLGNVASAIQSHQEALDLYRRALAHNPQDSMICSGIGNVYRRLRLYQESLHWLSKAVINKPDDESALKYFSQAVMECPEKDLAADALSEVIQVVGDHPSLERAMSQLGVVSDAS